jgi:hypothetical protein
MTIEISLEANSKEQKESTLLVGTDSDVAKFNSKEVVVCAPGGGGPKIILWVEVQNGVNGGKVARSVYQALLGAEPSSDKVDLRELTPQQRIKKYRRLDIAIAALAVIAAVAASFQPTADQELGRLDAVTQVSAAATPLMASLDAGNITGARAADVNLTEAIARNSVAGEETLIAELVKLAILLLPIAIAVLGGIGIARAARRAPGGRSAHTPRRRRGRTAGADGR